MYTRYIYVYLPCNFVDDSTWFSVIELSELTLKRSKDNLNELGPSSGADQEP